MTQPTRAAQLVTRGVAAGRSAQRACERSSDWRRGAAGSPDPERERQNTLRLSDPERNSLLLLYMIGVVTLGPCREFFEVAAHEGCGTIGVAGGDGGVQVSVSFARGGRHVGLLRVQGVERLLDERACCAE